MSGIWTALAFTLVFNIGWFKVWLISLFMLLVWGGVAVYINRVNARKKKVYVKVSVDDRQLKLDCDNIFYIESQRNNVLLHCKEADYVTAGPLKKFEEMLSNHGFSKCHNAYIVNLSYVQAVQKEEVLLTNGVSLPIRRARKKEFMTALTEDIL